ncbi:MAG TPA: aminotransferase class I/II-fold pyridoxal phosphate-dependent enzyme [Nitrolancea sp.]|jgi:glutamate/tyrosine decarboxylase-like PLP-dependent enzyme|nr:aminotransferase class I/II-fold pyridoxal phosphate-dependent enzyme [Nitrolancea sp.]
MDRKDFVGRFGQGLAEQETWQAGWDAFEVDETSQVPDEQIASVFSEFNQRLHDNFPFAHPRYAAQMVKTAHPIAELAYAIAMQFNPNNHALDASAATSEMEKEVVADLARMFGYGDTFLGHLTSSGTIANLEALWIARSLHPDKGIAASDQAHYTHGRMCGVVGVPFHAIPTDARGRMELNALESALRSGAIGTVVATTGTTGLGSVDQVQEIIPLARRYGARVHVDAAYGGFFTLVARQAEPSIDPAPFLAIAESDSVVVDPHKHGLQPYGCGSVIFRDPTIGRFYVHDSPYTYFTSKELHLGEISLECSRAGAAAAAAWATFKCFPLQPEHGLGPLLSKCRQAATAWARLLDADERFRLVVEPELDILNFYPVPPADGTIKASAISALTESVYQGAMNDPDDPVFLAKFVATRDLLARNDPRIEWDEPTVTVLRSVLMKPEHLAWVPRLHRAVTRHAEAGAAARGA